AAGQSRPARCAKTDRKRAVRVSPRADFGPGRFRHDVPGRNRRNVLRQRMKLLLDTHLLLWTIGPDERLSSEARELIGDPDNEPLFGIASLWETAIKRGLQ